MSENKGRGIFASKNFSEGELIIVEKAVLEVDPDDGVSMDEYRDTDPDYINYNARVEMLKKAYE